MNLIKNLSLCLMISAAGNVVAMELLDGNATGSKAVVIAEKTSVSSHLTSPVAPFQSDNDENVSKLSGLSLTALGGGHFPVTLHVLLLNWLVRLNN
ncbi:MAG: hypothetical protein V4544_00100 [Pseudomonadota bacterium]